MKKLHLSILVLLICAAVWTPAETVVSHALAMRGEPKYPAGFRQFDYVNPNAPKGGMVTFYTLGTYDSFNRYAQRGDPAVASDSFNDTLMIGSDDEIDVSYGLIAEKVEYDSNYRWIIFQINSKARHQDGRAITAEDVVFSFNKFVEEGVPQFKSYYSAVEEVEAVDRLRVRFTLSESDKETMVSLGGLTVLPKHYWESRNLSEPLTEVPIGSGAYTVSDYRMGQYIIYERKKDYWARDLPVNRGRLNFDFIRYDFYRDQTVAFEAFKAGEYDIRVENEAKKWATQYTGSAIDAGYIKMEEIPHEIPPGMQAFIFNIQRPVFQDRRVRMALNYLMDFEWMNRNIFYDQYTRTRSYFQNTEYAATALPGREELKILEPIRDKIPPEVFSKEYVPPVTDGSGNIRTQIREATRLLQQAGWEVRNQQLVNTRTGEPFEFELMIYTDTTERIAIPLKKNLERVGITMNIRKVDPSQYLNRWHDHDFDMVSSGFSAHFYPDTTMKIVWGSDYIDSTYNQAAVQDEAVDYLLAGIDENQGDDKALLYWGRAFDRVVTWNHYVIPQWHLSMFRVASWDKFSRPAVRPKYTLGVDTWWVDLVKESRLPKR
ncbi:MAG: ABC transporter substrate-binding protein [Spirochaetaceae bacterium]|nr:MAG: ABC transporter substrate-binding protein [Spirochaetaceae bacterium]